VEVSDITPVAVVALKMNSELIVTPRTKIDVKSFENYVLKSSLFFMWCVFYLFATFTAKSFDKHAFGLTVSVEPSVCSDART
jgi:hypothetical protein